MDSRHRFRPVADAVGALAAQLRRDDGRLAACWLIELSAEGASVVARDEDPCLPLGSDVELVLEADGALCVGGIVARRRERGDERVYELWFDDPEDVAAAVVPRVLPLLERRAGARVEPAPGERVSVFVAIAPADELEAELVDVSTGGLTLRLPSLDEGPVTRAREVALRFVLPGWPDEVGVAATILHRRIDAGGVCLGVSFALDGVPGSDELVALIAQYVRRRTCERLG